MQLKNYLIKLRYFIELAYKGTNYNGWQYQPDAPSVQETLANALSTLLRMKIEIVGAGRTDTGVHAKQMFAHFDFDEKIDNEKLIQKLNSFLPKDIAVFRIIELHDDAHARFDATSRTYEYHINTTKNAFECNDSWYFSNELDVELMNIACQLLMKHNDFECFSKVHTDVNTFICSITKANWVKNGSNLVFTITADRFLRNMVRAIVGTMVNIGLKKTSLIELEEIIESKNRSKAGFSVPAHGLYLTEVKYDYIN